MPTHTGPGPRPGSLHPEPAHTEPDIARLLAALSTAGASLTHSTGDLHDAACAYAARLKAEGLRAEQVVVHLKTAIESAGLRRQSLERDALIDSVITDCIRAYYRD